MARPEIDSYMDCVIMIFTTTWMPDKTGFQGNFLSMFFYSLWLFIKYVFAIIGRIIFIMLLPLSAYLLHRNSIRRQKHYDEWVKQMDKKGW